MENGNNNITSDERLLSLLAHLSVLFGGIILPIVLWAVQKDKSNFVRFHSLQAIFYHIVYMAFIFIFVIILVFFMIFFGIGIGSITSRHHNDSGAFPALIILFSALFYIGLFAIIFAFIGYGVYIGVKAYGGEYKRIPVIGNIIYEKIFGKQ